MGKCATIYMPQAMHGYLEARKTKYRNRIKNTTVECAFYKDGLPV